jgi:hypothetical protein
MGTLGKIFSSRAVWGAALLGVMGILPTIAPIVPQGTWEGAIITIALSGFTIYARIRAKQPLGPVIDATIQKSVEAVHELQGQSPPSVAKVDAVTSMVKNPNEPLLPVSGGISGSGPS